MRSKIEHSFRVFGVIIGLVGILHGSAELYKGDVMVRSHEATALPDNWPNEAFHSLMDGSPVFSLLTDIPYYVLGLLAITVSLALIFFSARFFKLDVKGIILFSIFNIGIFLFGAGMGTPIALGLPMVIFGILSLFMTKNKERSERSRKLILYGFKVSYFLQIFSWVLFFPVLFVLSFYQEIPQWLFLFDFMIMPISILGAGVFGLMYDKS